MAEEKGFAIRCPRCESFNIWNDHPGDIALNSEEELLQIIKEFNAARKRGKGDSYQNRKLLRCKRPRWACPTSFEAFICSSEEEINRFSEAVEAWFLKRDFRLAKADGKSWWDDKAEGKYYGILFNTQPVERQRDIQLEWLMNRELLSRLIVGISVEIKLPVTIYGTNVFKKEKRKSKFKDVEYWMPIDAYPMGERLVPPRFNVFCKTCRDIVIGSLVKEFKDKNYGVDNCPLKFSKDGKCQGRKAACMQEPKDWNHCPYFIEERKKRDPCYKCDINLIEEKVRKKWKDGDLMEMENCVYHECWAGFRDIAFPIIVHEHLVGVLGTGQVFFDPEQIFEVDDIVKEGDILHAYKSALKNARGKLIYDEQEFKKDERSTFYITENQLNQITSLLHSNVERITMMANARYRDIRERSESAFRQEMLTFIEKNKMEKNFFNQHVNDVLERMRVFWAFQGVYLVEYVRKTNNIYVIAFNTSCDGKCFGIREKLVGRTHVRYNQMHPYLHLHKIGEKLPRDNPFLEDLWPIFENASRDSELNIPAGDYYLAALIPFQDEVYGLVFTVRDKEAVSSLKHRVEGSVSKVCQESVLATCTDVIHEFGDVREFVEAQQRAWKEFWALATHRIGNEISGVGTLLDVLTGKIVGNSYWAGNWEDKLKIMQGCIARTKTMLTEQGMLTGMRKPKLKPTDIEALIKRASEGLLPPTASLNTKCSGVQKKVDVDPDLMEQVFKELCINAVRFCGDKVRIDVEIRINEKQVCISFRDNGLGIKSEDRERVFKQFVSSRRSGSGLGLTIVRRIVEEHGGTIRVGSSEVGAHFIILLPLKGELQ